MIPMSSYIAGQQTLTDTAIDEANSQVLKAGPGMVLRVDATNTHATEHLWLKFFDALTTTVSTDVPKYAIGLPPNTSINVDFSDVPMQFRTGICYAATQQRGAGATAPTTDPSATFTFFASDS